jgi:hypothetical protein
MGQELVALLLSVVVVCSYLSVRVWIDARRMEREAFYRTEAMKKFIELQGNVSDPVLETLRTQSKKRAGLRRGVMTTTVNGSVLP